MSWRKLLEIKERKRRDEILYKKYVNLDGESVLENLDRNVKEFADTVEKLKASLWREHLKEDL